MALVPQAVGIVDRPHVPDAGDPHASTYKEWWHFNLLDDASGLDVIVNLSLSGNVREAGRGEANLILLAHEPGIGWSGGVTRFDGLAAQVDEVSVDIALGEHRLAFADDHYEMRLVPDAESDIAVDLRLAPLTEPMMVWKNTPIGSGHINWVIIPSLSAAGSVRVGEREYPIRIARAYHDHNWGHWRWGENFGWDWGFCSSATEVEAAPLSLVYDRTVDRTGQQIAEHSLALWHGEALLKFFSRRMMRMRKTGHYRGKVRRIPGVASLMEPSAVGTIPARVDIVARDGADWVEATYIPDTAIQIGIPRETGFGLVELNETLGWLTMSGEVAGMSFTVTRRSCFEFVG